MDISSMIEDYKRKKLLLQEDMEYLLKICDNITELLEKKEEQMHKMIDTMARYPKVEDEIVRFNVGGTVFATSRSNITKRIKKKTPTENNGTKVDNDQFYEPHMLEGLVSGIAAGRSASSQEIANVIDFLASPGASFVSGQTVTANGGVMFPG